MQRHDRETVRTQRTRWIAKRRQRLAFWFSGIDWWAITRDMEPRPFEERLPEFWDERRLGSLSKWNGNCTHCSRARRACPSRAERLERIRRREMWEVA